MYGVLAMAHIWGLFAPTSQTWIYSFWKRLMGSICWGKELAGFMMFNDDCTPPWKSRLVSSIRRPEKLPWLEISVGKSTFASHETWGQPRVSTESWGLGSTPWVGPLDHWRFLDFTLPEQLETLNFGDCYDQNLSRLIMPSGVKSLTLPFTRFFHMQLEELELPGGAVGAWHGYPTFIMFSMLRHVFLWIALCCMGSRAKKILFLW